MMSKQSHTTYADRPIEVADDDLLGRKNFAHAIAKRIAVWEDEENLVVSLYGDWGAGKSSIKNMIVESLNKFRQEGLNAKTPEVVEFNPWQFSGGSEQLCTEFFDALAGKIEELTPDSNTGDRRGAEISAKRLRNYGRKLSFASNLFKAGAVVLTAIAPPAAVIAAAGGVATDVASAVANSGAAAQEEQATLGIIKKELHADFEKLPRKLLVIIDDIDRLTSEEICLMFRLIKANTDFPNLIFLLLVQRESTEQALSSITHGDGARFLEKIVQMPFEVPSAPDGRIGDITFDRITRMFEPLFPKEKWQDSDWIQRWVTSLSPYFTNLRCTYRYLNALEFSSNAFKGKAGYSLNPFDLVTVEVLRMFEPKLYNLLPNYRAELTNDVDIVHQIARLTGDKADYLQRVQESLLKVVSEEACERMKKLLVDLFPALTGREDEHTWTNERLVASSHFFSNYFEFALSPNQVAEESIEEFKVAAGAGDYAALIEIFNRWKKNQVLGNALKRLDAEISGFAEIDDPVSLICAFFDNAENDINEFSDTVANWAIQILLQTTNEQKRNDIALKVINDVAPNAVSSLVEFGIVLRQAFNQKPSSFDDGIIISPSTYRNVLGRIFERLKSLDDRNEFLKHPSFSRAFWLWFKESSSSLIPLMTVHLHDPQSAIRLLGCFIDISYSSKISSRGKPVRQSTLSLYDERLRQMEQIAPLNQWESSLSEAEKLDLTNTQREELAIFKQTMARKKQAASGSK